MYTDAESTLDVILFKKPSHRDKKEMKIIHRWALDDPVNPACHEHGGNLIRLQHSTDPETSILLRFDWRWRKWGFWLYKFNFFYAKVECVVALGVVVGTTMKIDELVLFFNLYHILRNKNAFPGPSNWGVRLLGGCVYYAEYGNL